MHYLKSPPYHHLANKNTCKGNNNCQQGNTTGLAVICLMGRCKMKVPPFCHIKYHVLWSKDQLPNCQKTPIHNLNTSSMLEYPSEHSKKDILSHLWLEPISNIDFIPKITPPPSSGAKNK